MEYEKKKKRNANHESSQTNNFKGVISEKKKKQVTGRFFSAGDQVHYLALYYIPIDN